MPVPLTRVWCLWELHCAIKLGAEVIMCLSSTQAKEFYGRLTQQQRQQQAGGVAKQHAALVPTIDVRRAQATKAKDRERIFAKIEEEGGVTAFNARLQEFMEAALQEEARAALVSAAAGSMRVRGREGRVTLGMVQDEVKEMKNEMKEGLQSVKEEMLKGLGSEQQQEEMKEELKEEMKALARKQQQELKEELKEMSALARKQQEEMAGLKEGISALECKLDDVLARL
jgi:hypothetical protein